MKIKRGQKYGDWVVTLYEPLTYDDLGTPNDGVIKLVNQETKEDVFIRNDHDLKSDKWWVSYKSRRFEDKRLSKVIDFIVKKSEKSASRDAEPMVEISRGGRVEGAMTADEFRKALGLSNRIMLQDAVDKYNKGSNGVAEIVWKTKSKGKRVDLFNNRSSGMDNEKLASELVKLAKELVSGKTGTNVDPEKILKLVINKKMEVVEASHGFPFNTKRAISTIKKELKKSKNNVSAMLFDTDEVKFDIAGGDFVIFE